MKLKNAATFLLIASICGILVELYSSIKYFEYPYGGIIGLFKLLYSLTLPIALLVLSIALRNKNTGENTQIVEEKPSSNDLANNLTVGDWLVNFSISVIPLAGFAFLILWANDDKNKIRKNWALASLIWTGIIFVLSIFLYATILLK